MCGTDAVAPTRLLDTRTGVGAPLGALGVGGEVALQVVGQGGVPAAAQAVVLNVTATNATADTYITSYPSGSARPNASSLNVSAGRTAANLVLAKLGPDGAVRLFNENGAGRPPRRRHRLLRLTAHVVTSRSPEHDPDVTTR